MKPENVFILHPTSKEQERALKAFVRALKIKFEVSSDKPYDALLVEKVLQGRKELEEGKGTTYSIEELEELCK